MTDGKPAQSDPVNRARGFLACLAILLCVIAFSDAQDPMVKAFGLAHARLFENESGRVLVLDSLPSADAPAVQTVFQGEIWGRHAYQVQRILIPFLILLAAMACCSHLLARSVSGPGFRFFHLHRGTAPPPVALWVALFLGGCFAAWSVEQPAVHGTFALLPLIVSVFAGVAVAAQSHPNASTLVRAFEMLSACRWFWLGFLALSPEGLFRYEGVSDGPRPLGFSLAAVAAVFLLLALLHWVTSSTRSLDLQRCSGDSEAMRSRLERLNLLAIQELLLLFPAVLMATAVSSVRIESLTAYLLASITCAALMRWSMQPPKGGWAFRAFTILLVALPGSGQVREVFWGLSRWGCLPPRCSADFTCRSENLLRPPLKRSSPRPLATRQDWFSRTGKAFWLAAILTWDS